VNLVHQDLTPSNIVLRPSGRVGLLDFGIATTARDRRGGPLSGVRGTTGYMSPEQFARRHEVDRRADVFLLAQLLWEVTVGRALFPADDLAFFEAITRADIPTPSAAAPEYPPALEAILMRALSREPDARQATARELGDELLHYASAAQLEIGQATLRSHVEAFFPASEAPHYLPDEEHGAGDVPELLMEDDDDIFPSEPPASLSDLERRELLDELDLFAEHLEAPNGVEAEPIQDRSGVLGTPTARPRPKVGGKPTARPRPPPVPADMRLGRGDLQGASDDDSGVYMQLEPGTADQVFRDE